MFSSSNTSEEEEILDSLTVNRVGSTRGRSFDFFTIAARRQQIYATETVPATCEIRFPNVDKIAKIFSCLLCLLTLAELLDCLIT